MFASDNPKDAMPSRRKGTKEEDEISNTATLTVYNTLSYLSNYSLFIQNHTSNPT